MRPTRRSLLALLAVAPGVVLGACSPSPVVAGDPGQPWSPVPTEPVQSQAARRAAEWTVGMRALAQAAGDGAWAAGAVARSEAHLSRLLAADPLVPDSETVFAPPVPSTPPPADDAALQTVLDEQASEGVALFAELTAAAASQPERLLLASLGASAAGDRRRDLAPVVGGGSPIRFPDTTEEASLQVALTHAWALLHGLEVGLGRLPDGAWHDLAGARLNSARELRNTLRAALQGDPPEQEISYELPTPMSTSEEIAGGLAALEGGLLDALARLVAATTDVGTWFPVMAEQVAHVQDWGGHLVHWPGWTKV